MLFDDSFTSGPVCYYVVTCLEGMVVFVMSLIIILENVISLVLIVFLFEVSLVKWVTIDIWLNNNITVLTLFACQLKSGVGIL